MYMNQPTTLSLIAYYNITRLRNSLFFYINMKNDHLKFKSSFLIEEDKEFYNLYNSGIKEYKFSKTIHITDPPSMFLYNRRVYYIFIQ